MSKDIFMEPEEYEKYLQEQEKLIELAKEKAENSDKSVGSATLYELNQGIINGMPALNADGIMKGQLEFFDWISSQSDKPKYYMLLCSELNYYTLFHLSDYATNTQFWNELYDIAKELGTLKVMEIDGGYFTIWADWYKDNTPHLFYLFPYDRGVVEI